MTSFAWHTEESGDRQLHVKDIRVANSHTSGKVPPLVNKDALGQNIFCSNVKQDTSFLLSTLLIIYSPVVTTGVLISP